jgi:Ni,Fe-hydrogenase III small subunit
VKINRDGIVDVKTPKSLDVIVDVGPVTSGRKHHIRATAMAVLQKDEAK